MALILKLLFINIGNTNKVGFSTPGNHCMQILNWTGQDWIGLDLTTGLPLKLKVQHYNSILEII